MSSSSTWSRRLVLVILVALLSGALTLLLTSPATQPGPAVPVGWPKDIASGQQNSKIGPQPAIYQLPFIDDKPAAKLPGGEAAPRWKNEFTDGSPVLWDPCQPVVYTVQGATPAQVQEVKKLVSKFSGLSGLAFAYTEPQGKEWRLTTVVDDKEQWSPLTIRLGQKDAPKGEEALLSGLGVKAYAAQGPGHPWQYKTGQIFITQQLFTSDASDKYVFHALGHAMGLAHSDLPYQLMHPVSSGEVLADQSRTWPSGYDGNAPKWLHVDDLAILAKLSDGVCDPYN